MTASSPFQAEWTFTPHEYRLDQPVELFCFNQSVVAAVHPTNDISLVSLTSGNSKKLSSPEGHTSYINSVDISTDGLVVSTGDDHKLIVWELEQSNENQTQNEYTPKVFNLGGVGKSVRFWRNSNADWVVVLEAGNKVKILDWRKSKWMTTIYIGQSGCCGPLTGSVKDIFIVDDFLYAIGLGWWKKFDLTALDGGTGITFPKSEGHFYKNPNSSSSSLPVIPNYTEDSHVMGLVTRDAQYIHDILKNSSESTFKLDYKLPTNEISAAAVRSKGDVLAVVNDKILTLIGNSFKEEE